MAHRYYRATDVAGAAVTGDAANHTLRLVQGAGVAVPGNAPAELGYGFYALELAAEETAEMVIGESSTEDVTLWPVARLPEFSAVVAGRMDVASSSLAPASTALSTATWTEALATLIATALDATMSSRAPASTALSTATWTAARAALLDRLTMTLTQLRDAILDAIPASIAATLSQSIVTADGTSDYTADEEIVRGSRWPAGGGTKSIEITKSGGWPDGADAWTWTLCLAQGQGGGDVDLEIEADTVSLDGSVMTLEIYATAAQTATLPGTGRTKFNVELKSDDGADDVSYYGALDGYAFVRDPAGARS